MKKRIFILAALTLTLSACMKESADMDLRQEDWLIGTWYEYYDPTVFAFDGSSEVTISEDGTARWHYYDLLGGGSSDIDYRYTIEKSIITLVSGSETDAYEVIFLNRNEMAWQRVGTTYSKGTWSSDYKHFLRSKD